jgi:MFS family permease
LRRTEIIDRERRWARPAAFAAFGVLILFVASRIVAAGADVGEIDDQGDLIRAYAEESALVTSDVIAAFAVALIAPALLYLFRAAQARSDAVRSGLAGLVVAGPLFYAVGAVLQGIAFQQAGDDLIAMGLETCDDDCATDLIAETSVASFATGLSIAGALGLAAAVVYTCLNAMRTGLITRFLGTFGMATGVLVILGPVFGAPLGSLLLVFLAVALGLIYMGWRRGGRPPAWEAGEAIPWPAPGERPSEPARDDESVEGRAEEVFPDAAAEEPEEDQERRPADAPEPGSIADEVERASERPQKSKKRS